MCKKTETPYFLPLANFSNLRLSLSPQVVFLSTKPSPTPIFFPKSLTTLSHTFEKSSSLNTQAFASLGPMLPMPIAMPLLTLPAPKTSELAICNSANAASRNWRARIFSGTFGSLTPPMDQTSLGTWSRRVI